MRLFWLSAMYRLPAESTATPQGVLSWALVAGPPSPEKPVPPFPATVEMIPPGVTLRMRLVTYSAKYRLPAESTATEYGLFKFALVAGPPSPLPPDVPPPATVVIVPPGVTLRIR